MVDDGELVSPQAEGEHADDGGGLSAMARPRDEEWVLVLCEDCGRPFHLSARQGRAIRAEKRSARCRLCRRVVKRQRVEVHHYRFWQARFTDAEIVEIAVCCWGELETWVPDWLARVGPSEEYAFVDAVPPR